MPSVSVILPNYNHADFLRDRIESILNQSFQDFELIILDDCSSDISCEIIKSYEDHPLLSHIVINKENSGSTFKQWEKGLALASGEFIWIAESDDLAELNFLEHHMKMFKANKSLGVSFSASTWIDEKGKTFHEPEHEYELYAQGSTLLKDYFIKGNLIYNASSCVFKKSLVPWETLKAVIGYKYCGDWLFWVDLVANTEINRTSKRLNFFRRHSNNVSFEAESKGLQFSEGLKVVNHIFEKQHFSFFEKQKLIFYWVQKLRKSSIENKKRFIGLLPFPAKISYAVSPAISSLMSFLAS